MKPEIFTSLDEANRVAAARDLEFLRTNDLRYGHLKVTRSEFWGGWWIEEISDTGRAA